MGCPFNIRIASFTWVLGNSFTKLAEKFKNQEAKQGIITISLLKIPLIL
jgi:hypothetical protein